MAEKKERKEIIKKLKNKYRLVIYNDTTFAEVWQVRLSQLNVFAYGGISVILIITLVFLLLVYSPLKIFLPYYSDSELHNRVIENGMRLDSLQNEIEIRDKYMTTFKAILQGKTPDDFVAKSDSTKRVKPNDKVFAKSEADSLLRIQIEREEKFNLTVSEERVSNQGIRHLNFFAPINKGLITNHFDFQSGHFAVDLVAEPNSGVMAVLDGTVIMASWTLETGNVIQIQHENNLISVYKHNSALLKTIGNHVKAGEPIAIIGNSGELTTGPHLHFELWHNGTPINPEDYIVF